MDELVLFWVGAFLCSAFTQSRALHLPQQLWFGLAGIGEGTNNAHLQPARCNFLLLCALN